MSTGSSPNVTVTGTVQRILFPKTRSADASSDFRIFLVQSQGDTFSVKGSASTLKTGSTVSCDGVWEKHSQFGNTLKAALITEVLPTSLVAIEGYLTKAQIVGLGAKTAKLIVEHFGENVFDVLDRFPERLTEVKGIKQKTAEQITEGWQARRAVHTIMLFLQSNGVAPGMADKVYQRMGGDGMKAEAIIERLRKNPYLIADIHGIGFKTADEMAVSLGIPHDSPFRIVAGLAETMNEQSGNGHTMLPWTKAIGKTGELLGLGQNIVAGVIRTEIGSSPNVENFMHDDGEYVALSHLRRAEERIAQNLLRLKRYGQPIAAKNPALLKGPFLTAEGHPFDGSQEQAVITGSTNPVIIFTGRPGTGKTSTTREIIERAKRAGLKIACCAPTGLAAIRLTEACGITATTVHRLLGIGSADPVVTLDIELLVCDEFSMMDSPITATLLDALPNGCVVILSGDIDQLPSVGPGNVLRDLIESDAFPVVRLTQIHRQQSKSGRGLGIIDGAHAVIEGRMPTFNPDDFRFVQAPMVETLDDEEQLDEQQTAKWIPVIVKRMHEQGTELEEIQILSPMNKGPLGVANLNLVMQAAFNPADGIKSEILYRQTTYREGDRVMQRKNDYQLGVVNGDIGYIESIDTVQATLRVIFAGGRLVELERKDLEHLSLAYASTIHKSQGSGFKKVIIPMTTGHYVMLNQNLIYTAITRTKTQCVLIGCESALAVAVRTKSNSVRCTGLERMLRAATTLKAA